MHDAARGRTLTQAALESPVPERSRSAIARNSSLGLMGLLAYPSILLPSIVLDRPSLRLL